jgi:hypothetical protein
MKNLQFLIAVLFLALPAFAQEDSAAYMTVRLEQVPASVQDAYMNLDEKTWVPLERVSEHEWKGGYLLLPGLYDKIAQPEIRFLDLHGLESSIDERTNVQVMSSTHRFSDLQAILDDGVEVVVSGDVVKDTLVLEDVDGTLRYPQFRGSAFTLPAIESKEVATIHVRTDSGTKVSYAFGMDVDLADLEESLEQ